jgi:hypothetical protein
VYVLHGSVLQTKEAKEAIGTGFLTMLQTGSLDKGIDAMLATGEKNGSLPVAKLAFFLDLINSV